MCLLPSNNHWYGVFLPRSPSYNKAVKNVQNSYCKVCLYFLHAACDATLRGIKDWVHKIQHKNSIRRISQKPTAFKLGSKIKNHSLVHKWLNAGMLRLTFVCTHLQLKLPPIFRSDIGSNFNSCRHALDTCFG